MLYVVEAARCSGMPEITPLRFTLRPAGRLGAHVTDEAVLFSATDGDSVVLTPTSSGDDGLV